MANCNSDDVYIPCHCVVDNTAGLGVGLVNTPVGDTTLVKTLEAGTGISLAVNGAVGSEYVTITSTAGGLATLQSAYDNSLPGTKIILNNALNDVSINNDVGNTLQTLFSVNNNGSSLFNVDRNRMGILSSVPASTGGGNLIIGPNNTLTGTNNNSIAIGNNNDLPDLNNTIVLGNNAATTYSQDDAIYKNTTFNIDMYGDTDPFDVNSSPSEVKQGFTVVSPDASSTNIFSLQSDAAFDTAYILEIRAVGRNAGGTFVAGLKSTHSFGYNSVPQITLSDITATTFTGISITYVAPNFNIDITNNTGQALTWKIITNYTVFRV